MMCSNQEGILIFMTNLQKKTLYSVAAAFFLLLAVSAYIAYNVLWGSGFLVFKVTPVTNVVDRVRAIEKSGGTIELSEADMNGVLELYLKKVNSSKDILVSGIYTGISDGKINFHVPLKYKSWGFMLYSEGRLVYKKDNFCFVPSTFRIGKLSLPVDYILKKLSLYSIKDTAVKDNSITINRNFLPFDVSSLSIKGDKIVAFIQKSSPESLKPEQLLKPVQAPTVAQGNRPTTAKSNEQTSETAREALLRRASLQLSGVMSEVKTSKEKEIMGEIQFVVGKMSADPSYPYKPAEDAVKSQYSRLSPGEKDDIKNAILDNMETDTLKQIKTTFGL